MTAKDIESILWLVPAIPLVASLINGLISILFLRSKAKKDLTGGQLTARYATSAIGIVAIASALVISLICLFYLIGQPAPAPEKSTATANSSQVVATNNGVEKLAAPALNSVPVQQAAEATNQRRVEVQDVYTWIPSGNLQVKLGFILDPLTAIMMVVVCTISLLVHIFSTGYMRDDNGFHRFFTYLPFFTFSMLGLVLVNNFLWLFVFWEAVGLSSYLLIGFWFSKKYDWGRLLPPIANIKAFVVNRIGDFGFTLGIMWIFVTMIGPVGDAYAKQHGITNVFDRLSYTNVFGAFEQAFTSNSIDHLTLTLICLLLFMGAMGKSAQMPLHVWLPDAMAGPTPVSALIHAATMVTAGVYMVGRVSPLFSHTSEAMLVVSIIGVITAFFGSTVGTTQKDIKAVMAYSTVSQLGYMFFALGVFGWTAAFFHLMTHAFFKGLLFLGCGSVIHANEETIHHGFHEIQHNAEHWAKQRFPNDPARAEAVAFELYEAAEHAIEYGVDPKSKDELFRMGLDPQSMDYMGNLSKGMKLTAWSMTFGAAALAGIPLTAGFWSKDEILGTTFARGAENGLNYVIYGIGLFAALLTAFYSFRMIFSVFWSGNFRLPEAMNRLAHEGMRRKAAELGIANFNPRELINFTDGYENATARATEVPVKVTENTPNMTLPLVFLAFMSIAAGYVGLPNAVFGNGANLFEGFLDSTFEPALAVKPLPNQSSGEVLTLLIVSAIVALSGVTIAWLMYHRNRSTAPLRAGRLAGPLYAFSYNKWYFDDIYNLVFVQGGLLFARGWSAFDRYVIDGAVNGVGWLTRWSAQQLRKVQTGFIGNYALIMAIGLVVIVAIFYITMGIKF
ncbi:MAG TPA: NADH-quinone oxidoreductase subunit L [Chloroflexia bacterium]|nr:NADH-quinone oxidoreductase subunit L [Chloroflexia bacterium]